MRVIPPLTITDAVLTSSTAAEPGTGEVAWNAATSYTVGTVAYRPNHKRYENLIAGVDATLPENSTDRWLELGPTNRWAMFDLLRNTQTVAASPLTVVLAPGARIDSMALLGLEADSVTVTMTSGGSTVYSHTEQLNYRETFDWYEYCFEPFERRPSMVLWDLPPYAGASITLTITSATGTVKCGACVLGSYEYLGKVVQGASDDAVNFSKIERNFAGDAALIPRRSVPKTVQNVFVDKARVKKVRGIRADLNAVPAVWSGLDDDAHGYFESLFILGIYKQFSFNLEHDVAAMLTLELEEI